MKFELDAFNRNTTDDELLQDLLAADAKLQSQGKCLTSRSYKEFEKYSASTIRERFGSWNDGLRRAGLVPKEEKNISVDARFDNMKLVWIAKGKQPTYRDMNSPPSQFTASTYNSRFGGWRNALQEFVKAVADEQDELLTFEAEVKSNRITKKTNCDPSLRLKFMVLKRDNFRCVACGRSPATQVGLVLEIDHVVPWSKGGETIEDNLQSLCFDCNRGKGAT